MKIGGGEEEEEEGEADLRWLTVMLVAVRRKNSGGDAANSKRNRERKTAFLLSFSVFFVCCFSFSFFFVVPFCFFSVFLVCFPFFSFLCFPLFFFFRPSFVLSPVFLLLSSLVPWYL
jgi:hypothetical protein